MIVANILSLLKQKYISKQKLVLPGVTQLMLYLRASVATLILLICKVIETIMQTSLEVGCIISSAVVLK